jgi:hypothetical protein
MEQKTFEGTWEEILLRAFELTGRRVKLIILTIDTLRAEATEILRTEENSEESKV